LSESDYAEEIASNRDCQLPLYGMAAQQFFFGGHNADDLNRLTSAVYHIQARRLKDMTSQFLNRRVSLNGSAGEAPLLDAFLATLWSNMDKIALADFSVRPLDCTFCDYAHICRVDVNALEAAANP
jgi:hypothetical protein